MRICSLLPGATEVVAALGLADDLVGISHECDFPPAVRNKPVMVRAAIDQARLTSLEIDRHVRAALNKGSRLYALDETLFALARPELIITQDLCHVCAVTPDQLHQAIASLFAQPRVLSLNPTSLEHILTDVERIGAAAGRAEEARSLALSLRARLDAVRAQVAHVSERPRVVCLEWLEPLYIAGHWVPEMVEAAGGRDVLGTAGAPSFQATWAQVLEAKPEVLVLMPCGFSVDRTLRELAGIMKHPGWDKLPAVQTGRVFAVDAASYFSRPGPRLVDGVALLAAICHPTRAGAPRPPAVHIVYSPEERACSHRSR